MTNIIITVGNSYFHGVTEEFITRCDITDLEELEMAADECCGEYLDLHGDLIHALTPDCSWEEIAEACYYSIEEAPYESN